MAVTRRTKTNDDLWARARDLAIFQGAGEKALNELVSVAACHNYPKNNILFYQGDPAGAVFLVADGRVHLTLNNEEGKEVIVSIVRPGGLVGLVSALDRGPQPANAITASPSRLARFSGQKFVAWMERHGVTQKALLGELAQSVRQAYQKVGEYALMGVKERLLYALSDIAEREGKPAGGETIVFTRPTHQELADRIGSSREVVSRVLKELLESDLLQAEGRIIRVSESALVLRED